MVLAVVVVLDAGPTADLPDQVAAAVRRALPGGEPVAIPGITGRLGRPPFGFRRRRGRLVPDPRESAVLRDLFAAATADPATPPADLARALIRGHPWLAEQWSRPKDRSRRIVSLLDLRPSLEPLLCRPSLPTVSPTPMPAMPAPPPAPTPPLRPGALPT